MSSLKAFVLALILNSTLFLSMSLLNEVRRGPITVIKKYPVSLYRLEIKRPEMAPEPRARPQARKVGRPKRPEPAKQERPKGEKDPPKASAPIEEREIASAYEADLLSQPEIISSHAEGEPTAKEEVMEELPLVYDISELDRPLELLRYKLPAYPLLAQKMGVEATLVLRLLINERGLVEEIELLESNVGDGFGFFHEAKEAIKDWRFSRPRIDGEGVLVFYVFPLRFVPE